MSRLTVWPLGVENELQLLLRPDDPDELELVDVVRGAVQPGMVSGVWPGGHGVPLRKGGSSAWLVRLPDSAFATMKPIIAGTNTDVPLNEAGRHCWAPYWASQSDCVLNFGAAWTCVAFALAKSRWHWA